MNLKQQKSLVAKFLRQCNAYADGKLDEYADRLTGATPDAARDIETRIAQWRSYRAFNEHALGELATERLDSWFEAVPDAPDDDGTAG
jgi:hypothetical protein